MPVGFPLPPSYPPNVFNYNPQFLRNWRKGLANVKSGTANCRLPFFGDSTLIGINAAGSLTWPNLTTAIGNAINNSGVPCNSDSFNGFSVAGSTTGSRLGTDPRLTAGGFTSTTGGGISTAGGSVATSSSVGTPLLFTPSVPVDTCTAFYVGYGTGGQATAKLGATGNVATINESQGTGVYSATSTTTLAAQTMSVSYVSGNSVYILGFECYNSAVKSVNLINAGWWGSVSSNWNNTVNIYGPINMAKFLAAPCYLICLGINDWIGNLPVGQYITNMTALIAACKISGDVILTTPTPNTNSIGLQPQYVAAMYQLAEVNNCVLIDNYNRFVNETIANSLGFMSDSIHPSPPGYADQSQLINDVLLNI